MNGFGAALWGEALKARRTSLLGFTVMAVCVLPAVGGLFMIILKDPVGAQDLGLISTKAELLAGAADWPTYLGILSQGLAVAGSLIFGLITAWVFGREFAERTAKELLAVPTPRSAIVAAKLVVSMAWAVALTLIVIGLGLGVGWAVDIPGWSVELAWSAVTNLLLVGALTALLLPWVAFLAGVGHGYLAPIGWMFLVLALAQIMVVLGWGDLFPWSVPALISGAAGQSAARLGWHSYLLVVLAGLAGVVAVVHWWREADQVR